MKILIFTLTIISAAFSINAQNKGDELALNNTNSDTQYVLLQSKNNSATEIPSKFLNDILELNFRKLNSPNLIYNTSTSSFNAKVIVVINNINVSQDKLVKSTATEKEILGNQGCRNRTVPVTCEITKSTQSKKIDIEGQVIFYNQNNEVLKIKKIAISNMFKHSSYKMQGNKRALSGKSKSLISKYPNEVPFPTEKEMVLLCTSKLKKRIAKILTDNERLLCVDKPK